MTAAELPGWFLWVFSFAFGSAWGSFANVVVYRWPNELSVVSPPSHCPHCGKNIRAYDNVPVLAWLWLRGRCRDCRAPISPRYPLVELAFGLAAMALAARTFRGDGAALAAGDALLHFLVRFSVLFALGVAALIDLAYTLVPNFITWFAVAPVIAALGLPTLAPSADAVGALAGAGLGYFGLRLLFIDGLKLLIGRPGMGLGDAHLLAVVGALLGPAGVLFALGAGAVQGVIAAAIAAALGVRIGADDVDDAEDYDPDEHEHEHEQPPREGEAAVETARTVEGHATAETAETGASRGGELPSDNDHGDDHDNDDRQPPDAPARPAMKLPFVPFLALGAVEFMLGADTLVARWLAP